MSKKYFYIIILLLVTFILVIVNFLDINFTNDTFYSIKIGKDIFKYGIDFKDHYSWINSLSYTYPHWLFDVLVFVIYKYFSYKGIYIFTLIAYMFVGIIQYYCLKKLCNSKLVSFIIMIISIILIKNYAMCRAHIITYSLIMMFYYNITRLNVTQNKKYIFYLSIISLLIANLHVAVWPFIFLLFLPFFVEYLFVKIIKQKKLNLKFYYDKYNIKLLIISFIICLLMGLLTPLKFIPYTYLFNTLRGVSQYYIIEHQPLLLWSTKLLVVYIFIILFILHNKKLKLNDIFLLLGLTIMMLSSRRHETLFVLLSSFVLVKYIDLKKLKNIKLKNYKYFYTVVISSCIICFIWYPCINNIYNKFNKENFLDNYPVEAVNYIKNNLDYKNIRIYNEYKYGSYLLFNDIKCMFDSRADLYTIEFNKKYDYFTEFMEINGKNYIDIFDKYNIEYILISKDNNLNIFLENNKLIKNIYQDDEFNIYKYNKIVKLD